MKPTLMPRKLPDRVGRKSVRPDRSFTTFAARKRNFAPRKRVPSWQPSAGWQPPRCIRRSSCAALVELVVPHGVEVEPDLVHRLDRRLVVEERRQERRGPDQVAGRDHQRVRGSSGRLAAEVRGQVLGAAGGNARLRRAPGRSCRASLASRCPWKSFRPRSWTFDVPRLPARMALVGRGDGRQQEQGERGREGANASACPEHCPGPARSILGRRDLSARPVRELRAHEARDGRALRRRLRARARRQAAGLLPARGRLLRGQAAARGGEGGPRRGRPRATWRSRSAAASS